MIQLYHEIIHYNLGRSYYKKDVLPEKDLLEKTATMKRFKYWPLGKELKAQTDIVKKQYQKLDDDYELDNIIKKEKPTLDLIHKSNYSFYKYYCDSKRFLESKYPFLADFFRGLNKFNKLKTQQDKNIKEKSKCV